jgi:hypothetical protein
LNFGGMCLTMFFAEIAAFTPVCPALSCFTMFHHASGVSYIAWCVLRRIFHRGHTVSWCVEARHESSKSAQSCAKTGDALHRHAAFARKYTCVPVSGTRMPFAYNKPKTVGT